jgi:hypothetical protein
VRHHDLDRGALSFGPAELVAVRRNPVMIAVAAFPLALTLALVILGLAVNPALLVLTMFPGIFAMLTGAWVWRDNPWPVEEPVGVIASPEGLTVDGRLIPREALVDGAVLPGKQPRVRLSRRWATSVQLRVGDVAQGRALLRALGLDASQVAGVFRTASMAFSDRRGPRRVLLAAALLAALLACAITLHSAFLGMTVLALTVMSGVGSIAAMMLPTTVRVGADGVALSWPGSRRFIGYGEVERVLRYTARNDPSYPIGVELALRTGEVLRLPAITTDGASSDLLCERIREAMETWSSGGAEGTALLYRKGRGLAEWITALRALGAGANADMRTPPVPRDRLWRIVESPTSEGAVRAAAAAALGGDVLSDEDRARLRGAARAVAAPKLRFAIEAAAGGSEEELAAALAEVEDDEAAGASRA